jgi:hypothetical protein
VKHNGAIFEHQLVALIRVKNGRVIEFLEHSDTGKMERAMLKRPPTP